nr:MAG TPA: capsid assembly protein [Caudoviricetes sp.]
MSDKENNENKNSEDVIEQVNKNINESFVGVNQFKEIINDNSDLIDIIDNSIETNVINSANDSFSNRCNLYDNMSSDSIISAALEMYADDAYTTTPDGDFYTVSPKIQQNNVSNAVTQASNFLKRLNIDKKLWQIYYQLAKYGECYLELFYKRVPVGRIDNYTSYSKQMLDQVTKSPEAIQMEDYCEILGRPDEISDVVYRGSTLYYLKNKQNDGSSTIMQLNNTDTEYLLPSHKYIHFTLGEEDSSKWTKVQIKLKQLAEQTQFVNTHQIENQKTIIGRILHGRSLLYDIEKAYRNLSLMENVSMISKLSRAQVTRVANIEVGGMSKADTRKALQRVKNKVKNKMSINEDTGSQNYVDVSGLDNTIVNPTQNGKGALDFNTLDRTEPDIKSVVDLDYFSNKLFGGLKIPKAYLGFEADLNDSGGDTLAQLSIRYSRTITKIQSAVENGLSDLCYLYLISSGFSEFEASNIKINIMPPVTKEEQDKLENMSTKLESIDKIVNALPDDEDLRSKASIALLKELGNNSLTKLLTEYELNRLSSNETDSIETNETDSEIDDAFDEAKKNTSLPSDKTDNNSEDEKDTTATDDTESNDELK